MFEALHSARRSGRGTRTGDRRRCGLGVSTSRRVYGEDSRPTAASRATGSFVLWLVFRGPSPPSAAAVWVGFLEGVRRRAVPASCSRRIPMICSSVNRLGFIVHPLHGDGL